MKKSYYSVILLFVIIISLDLFFMRPEIWKNYFNSPILSTEIKAPFVVGTHAGPYDLDPHLAWDTASFNVIYQVCEGLFRYDLRSPEMSIVPHLAEENGFWSIDQLSYTVSLKTNITFHDTSFLNAFAVHWTFNRLAYFMNISGTLPYYTRKTWLEELYRWPDNVPIINRTETLDTYTIKFVLNRPYAPFQALLCFSGSSILSPSSTPPIEYIDLYEDTLIGTGPFVYDGYNEELGVFFHAYNKYWQGKADIDKLIFSIIPETNERVVALLSDKVQFLSNPPISSLPDFKSNPYLTVLDSGKTSSVIYYLGMNNKRVNRVWRQAISYAINYSYIIDNLYGGYGARLKSPIPIGTLYANWSLNYAEFNILKAREILQTNGIGVGLDPNNDLDWILRASFHPLATFNYSYNIGSQFKEDLYLLLKENLEKIGVKVGNDVMTWNEYISRIFNLEPESRDKLELYFLGWISDFNDPDNIIRPLFSNNSYWNIAQVNDQYLEDLIQQGIITNNPSKRREIYNKIQRYLVEELMPWAYLFTPKLYQVFHSDLTGFQENALNILNFYSCNWNRDGECYSINVYYILNIILIVANIFILIFSFFIVIKLIINKSQSISIRREKERLTKRGKAKFLRRNLSLVEKLIQEGNYPNAMMKLIFILNEANDNNLLEIYNIAKKKFNICIRKSKEK
ncbi:MAG: ABC transporter substrate-binding protein [Candidatus Hodarchaeota archaeon]